MSWHWFLAAIAEFWSRVLYSLMESFVDGWKAFITWLSPRIHLVSLPCGSLTKVSDYSLGLWFSEVHCHVVFPYWGLSAPLGGPHWRSPLRKAPGHIWSPGNTHLWPVLDRSTAASRTAEPCLQPQPSSHPLFVFLRPQTGNSPLCRPSTTGHITNSGDFL